MADLAEAGFAEAALVGVGSALGLPLTLNCLGCCLLVCKHLFLQQANIGQAPHVKTLIK